MDDEKKAPVRGGREAVLWLLGKLDEKLPKHQHKGPIKLERPSVRVCPACTRMFAQKERRRVVRPVGVQSKHWKRHQEDHKLGRIRAVSS